MNVTHDTIRKEIDSLQNESELVFQIGSPNHIVIIADPGKHGLLLASNNKKVYTDFFEDPTDMHRSLKKAVNNYAQWISIMIEGGFDLYPINRKTKRIRFDHQTQFKRATVEKHCTDLRATRVLMEEEIQNGTCL